MEVQTRVRTLSSFCGNGCTTYRVFCASGVGVRFGLPVIS
jgi:hypothetical protein